MPFSAKNILNDAQITLEKAATDKFGNVVEDFVKGGLGGFLPAVNENAPVNRNDGSWYATSYAAGLAGGTSFRPKLKFLFKVEFIFTDAAKAQYRDILSGAGANDFTFMIKAVDRPKVDFEYEEDVNMYNFRTKVLKKIRHRDLTITFMDDVGNRVFNFFRVLMMIHSPITRGQLKRDNSLEKPNNKKLSVGSGMAFNGDQDDLAILQMNLLLKDSCDGWHLQEQAIKLLKNKYNGQVLSIFNETISLIPRDPFFISTSSSLTSITTAGGVFSHETGTISQYGGEQKEVSKEKFCSSKQKNIDNPSSLLIEGKNNLNRL